MWRAGGSTWRFRRQSHRCGFMRTYTTCPTCGVDVDFIQRGGLVLPGREHPICANGHAFRYVYNAPNVPLPNCCGARPGDPVAKKLYAAYNRGGDAATAGLNYAGQPCPTWEELPDNVRAKWETVAAMIA